MMDTWDQGSIWAKAPRINRINRTKKRKKPENISLPFYKSFLTIVCILHYKDSQKKKIHSVKGNQVWKCSHLWKITKIEAELAEAWKGDSRGGVTAQSHHRCPKKVKKKISFPVSLNRSIDFSQLKYHPSSFKTNTGDFWCSFLFSIIVTGCHGDQRCGKVQQGIREIHCSF